MPEVKEGVAVEGKWVWLERGNMEDSLWLRYCPMVLGKGYMRSLYTTSYNRMALYNYLKSKSFIPHAHDMRSLPRSHASLFLITQMLIKIVTLSRVSGLHTQAEMSKLISFLTDKHSFKLMLLEI